MLVSHRPLVVLRGLLVAAVTLLLPNLAILTPAQLVVDITSAGSVLWVNNTAGDSIAIRGSETLNIGTTVFIGPNVTTPRIDVTPSQNLKLRVVGPDTVIDFINLATPQDMDAHFLNATVKDLGSGRSPRGVIMFSGCTVGKAGQSFAANLERPGDFHWKMLKSKVIGNGIAFRDANWGGSNNLIDVRECDVQAHLSFAQMKDGTVFFSRNRFSGNARVTSGIAGGRYTTNVNQVFEYNTNLRYSVQGAYSGDELLFYGNIVTYYYFQAGHRNYKRMVFTNNRFLGCSFNFKRGTSGNTLYMVTNNEFVLPAGTPYLFIAESHDNQIFGGNVYFSDNTVVYPSYSTPTAVGFVRFRLGPELGTSRFYIARNTFRLQANAALSGLWRRSSGGSVDNMFANDQTAMLVDNRFLSADPAMVPSQIRFLAVASENLVTGGVKCHMYMRCNVWQPLGDGDGNQSRALAAFDSLSDNAAMYGGGSTFTTEACATCNAAIDCNPQTTLAVQLQGSDCACRCNTTLPDFFGTEWSTRTPHAIQCVASDIADWLEPVAYGDLALPSKTRSVPPTRTVSFSALRTVSGTISPPPTPSYTFSSVSRSIGTASYTGGTRSPSHSPSSTPGATPSHRVTQSASFSTSGTGVATGSGTSSGSRSATQTVTLSMSMTPVATTSVSISRRTASPSVTASPGATATAPQTTSLTVRPPFIVDLPKSVDAVLGRVMQNEEVAAVVASTGSASAAVAGVSSPAVANKAANMNRLLGAIGCRFIPGVDTTLSKPDPTLFIATPKLGSEAEGRAIGACLVTLGVIGLLLVAAGYLWPVSQATQRGRPTWSWRIRRIVGVLIALTLSYYCPNVISLATTLTQHSTTAGGTAAGWIFVILTSAIVIYCGAVVATLPTPMARRLAAPMAYERRGSLRPVSRPSAHGHAGFSGWRSATAQCLTPLFDACADPASLPLRMCVVEDVLAACAMGVISGVKPREAPCSMIASLQLAVVAAHLAYVVIMRPFAALVDGFVSTVIGALQLAFAVSCVVIASTDEDTPETNRGFAVIGWVSLILSALLLIFTGVVIHGEFMAMVHSKEEAKRLGLLDGTPPVSSDDDDAATPILAVAEKSPAGDDGDGLFVPTGRGSDTSGAGAPPQANPLAPAAFLLAAATANQPGVPAPTPAADRGVPPGYIRVGKRIKRVKPKTSALRAPRGRRPPSPSGSTSSDSFVYSTADWDAL